MDWNTLFTVPLLFVEYTWKHENCNIFHLLIFMSHLQKMNLIRILIDCTTGNIKQEKNNRFPNFQPQRIHYSHSAPLAAR